MLKLEHNIGIGDMVIRLIIGMGLLYIGVLDETVMKTELSRTIITIIGINSFLTGLFRYCPIFSLLGLRSKPYIKPEDLELS
jgi:hypothetical protein